jgi:predicted dehydrogenase
LGAAAGARDEPSYVAAGCGIGCIASLFMGRESMSRIHRRRFLQQSAAIGTALSILPVRAQSVNEKLNIGFIGLGGRGNELMKQFGKLSDVRIAAVCDPDQKLLDEAGQKHSAAKKYADLRKLLDDADVDAVAIATCNHWHALAAIWACQAGKHVYVEKPLAHNHWEGQQVIRAARKHDRIVQVGTQQRSDPLQEELKNFLHDENGLGDIEYVMVCRFGKRASIGKRPDPLQPPNSLDYDLWLGPARDMPVYRDNWHYDWHWNWNTGNGEMGNWGVHVIDDMVNVVLRDRVPFPKRLLAAGGRVAWQDAGETPNVCFAYFDSGSVPVLFGLTNLPDIKGGENDVKHHGVGSGYVVHCEGGYYAGGRGGGAAHDREGKVIRRFKGDSGAGHPRNFVDAVASRDRNRLNAEVQIGHQSTAWCNLVNIACRVGGPYANEKTQSIGAGFGPWDQLVGQAYEHLKRNGIDIGKTEFRISPVLEFDGGSEQFVGDEADLANQLLRREYRGRFEVSSIG